jgi:hypothetical protein
VGSHPLAVFWQLSRPSGWCKARWVRNVCQVTGRGGRF